MGGGRFGLARYRVLGPCDTFGHPARDPVEIGHTKLDARPSGTSPVGRFRVLKRAREIALRLVVRGEPQIGLGIGGLDAEQGLKVVCGIVRLVLFEAKSCHRPVCRRRQRRGLEDALELRLGLGRLPLDEIGFTELLPPRRVRRILGEDRVQLADPRREQRRIRFGAG